MDSREMTVAKAAALEGARAVMTHYKRGIIPHYKNSWDFATQADFDSEKAIISRIKKNFPEHAMLAEESGEQGSSPFRWIIDPLDGTHNFFFNVPLFGTIVALEANGEVKVAVIYLPVQKELYAAEKGRGAFLNGKKIRVSARTSNPLVSFGGFWGITTPFVRERFEKMAKRYPRDMRLLGSVAVQIAWIASGKIDGALMLNEKPWDIAPALIIEEAGGIVTGINDEKWTPYLGHYVAGTKAVHDDIIKIARD